MNPFFHLAPDSSRLPLVVLATIATVIASQAVISGAYSVSRQAERLGYLPRLTVRHTSRQERGQIYVAAVNWSAVRRRDAAARGVPAPRRGSPPPTASR